MNTENSERIDQNKNYSRNCEDLIEYQLKIAQRWQKRGNEIEEDVFAKFFFYFAGFNAIYFLWSIIDRRSQHEEEDHIKNILEKIDETKAKEVFDKVKAGIDYFCKRPPIQRMKKRTCNSPHEGDKNKGVEQKKVIQDTNKNVSEKIIALGKILYYVRCNLVHGSKEISGSGDDFEIIKNSIIPLSVFLDEAISWTKQQYPGEM